MADDCCATGSKKKGSGGTPKDLLGNITCPECGHVQPMKIPTNACQAFYKCEGCKKVIMAQKSCCVFCDFGDQSCPISQEHKK